MKNLGKAPTLTEPLAYRYFINCGDRCCVCRGVCNGGRHTKRLRINRTFIPFQGLRMQASCYADRVTPIQEEWKCPLGPWALVWPQGIKPANGPTYQYEPCIWRVGFKEGHVQKSTVWDSPPQTYPIVTSPMALCLAQRWINPDRLQIRNRFPCMQTKGWGTPILRDRVRASTHRQFFPWKELRAKLEIEWERPLGASQRPFLTGTSLQLQMSISTHLSTESDADLQWQEGKSRLVMKLEPTEICSPWLQAANSSQSRQPGRDASQPLPRCPLSTLHGLQWYQWLPCPFYAAEANLELLLKY